MANEAQILDFIIPEWALCPLVNGDFSALNDEEIKKVTEFTSKYGDTCSINGESFFSWRNDISGNIGGTCYDVQFVQIEN